MHFLELDTPSLLIDQETMLKNIESMQAYASWYKVALRPHTKTHKMPKLALLQEEMGCRGITVAKVGEAEEMAAGGLKDIFIANEIVGDSKLRRIRKLAEAIEISFGLDSIAQAQMVERIFDGAARPAEVLIEIEVGENRSGVVDEQDFLKLLDYLKTCQNIHLKGLFSHDGISYVAPTRQAAREISVIAQQRTLKFAELARGQGFDIAVVSAGSTPSHANKAEILEGITEIRPGTFIFMDASQGHALEDMGICAATVLATVMSKPTAERVILDVGAKGITMQSNTKGICATPGLGTILEYPSTHISKVYDEHAVIYDKSFNDAIKIGDKIRIIPVHICPVVNLHDQAYLIDKTGEVIGEIPVKCRGKMQ